MAGIGKTTVKDYHAVQVQGSPQLKEAVDYGEVAISDAAQVARHQLPNQQTEALDLPPLAANTFPRSRMRDGFPFYLHYISDEAFRRGFDPWPRHR